ncbi:MAG: hypothetical protein JWL95_28 [Gemmatimonadetes bacterium]|nr:hypothetical protein [Gemmatimonadota bacterium]
MNTPVGFIVSWRVPAIVTLADLRAGLCTAGLDPDMAPDLKPASLVSRSASFIARTTSGKDARRLARPVGPASRQITLEQTGANALTYTREAAIGFDGATGKLECDDPTIAATLDDTAAHISETRTASDVTRIVQRIVEEAGTDLIPVREQGGAYFVPQGSGVIEKVATVLEAIGGELSRFACTIGHGSDTSVANTITDYMLKQITELQEAVSELNEAGIRSDVKSRRLSRVAELRERVGAYATLVGTQAEALTRAIDVAEATLLAKLGAAPEAEAA